MSVKFVTLDAVITVEGPGAQTIANLIATKLNLTANNSDTIGLVTGKLGGSLGSAEVEEALPLPVMNFSKEGKSPKPERKEAVRDAEEVLALPTWNFAPA